MITTKDSVTLQVTWVVAIQFFVSGRLPVWLWLPVCHILGAECRIILRMIVAFKTFTEFAHSDPITINLLQDAPTRTAQVCVHKFAWVFLRRAWMLRALGHLALSWSSFCSSGAYSWEVMGDKANCHGDHINQLGLPRDGSAVFARSYMHNFTQHITAPTLVFFDCTILYHPSPSLCSLSNASKSQAHLALVARVLERMDVMMAFQMRLCQQTLANPAPKIRPKHL